MPRQEEHIEKARYNEQFFSSFNLDTTPFLDWVVNGIFYSALHYLDSYLASKGENPGEHRERIRLIQGDPKLGQLIFYHYMSLKDDSEGGRYNMKVFLPDEITNDILPSLNSIKTHLKKYIPEI
jgi:uncharacterized protein (UPF0332 family)